MFNVLPLNYPNVDRDSSFRNITCIIEPERRVAVQEVSPYTVFNPSPLPSYVRALVILAY